MAPSPPPTTTFTASCTGPRAWRRWGSRSPRAPALSGSPPAAHAFHGELYGAADMAPLWQLIRQRAGHVDRLRRLNLPAKGKTQAVLRDHQAIVKALQARDAAAAQDAVRAHLAGTLTFVQQVRQRHPQWVRG